MPTLPTLRAARLAALALTLTLAASPAPGAQTATVDVVELANGSVIRGTIIEQIPNQSIRMQTGDGSIFVFAMSDVVRISREAGAPSTAVVTPVAPPPAAAPQPTYGQAAYNQPAPYRPGVPLGPDGIPEVKSPSTATLFSVFIVGGGQFYAGETGKGLMLLAAAVVIPYAAATYYVNNTLDCAFGSSCDGSGTGVLYAGYAAGLAIWAYGIYDASDAARRANRRAAGLAVTPAALRDPVSGELAYGASVRIGL